MKRIGMVNIKDILRYRHEHVLSRAQIAAAVGVSTGTVSHVLARADAAELSWPLPPDLDDEALRTRLYPVVDHPSDRVQPDWTAILEALEAPRKRRRTGLTRHRLWSEYRDEALAQGGKAYTYSRFCALLKERQQGRPGKAQMRFHYAPGLYGLSDFSGKTLGLHTGRGEKDVEIFIAMLPHSNMIYAEAVPDQSVKHWTMAHRRALEAFGGVPERWIIDNLKAGVTRADREEPQLNPSFREFARHYGLAVLPARSGQATDKGVVEAAVKAVQTRILLVLRHETFLTLDAMNAAIRRELERLNDAPMACGATRRGLFEASERAALKPLPRDPWEWGEWIERKVAPNCHVRIHRNHYSVPACHVGATVHVRVGERMVELFAARDGQRIAVHRLRSGSNQYATRAEHMPDRLQAVQDIRKPDWGDILLQQARRIGPRARAWAERCFASRDFPEQAFATVQGMIRLADDHGHDRLEELCDEALDLNRLASGFLRERIRNGARSPAPRPDVRETIPCHGNIRGGDYYRNTKGDTS